MKKIITKKEVNDWFRGYAKTAAQMRARLMHNHKKVRGSAVLGKMYFFWYDPKHKAKLPIYDRFPLVFPIESYPDGFLGLNMHYLRPDVRKALLTELLKYTTNGKINERTRLRMSYELLSRIAALDLAKPCIKRYLYSHVQSPFLEVIAPEWEKAMLLPVDDFVYAE